MELKQILENAEAAVGSARMCYEKGKFADCQIYLTMVSVIQSQLPTLIQSKIETVDQPSSVPAAEPAAESPAELPAAGQTKSPNEPEPGNIKPFTLPEKVPGSGVLSELREPARKDIGVNEGSGKVNLQKPVKSQRTYGSGIITEKISNI